MVLAPIMKTIQKSTGFGFKPPEERSLTLSTS